MSILKKLFSSSQVALALMVCLFLLCNHSYTFSYDSDLESQIAREDLEKEFISTKLLKNYSVVRESNISEAEDL